MTGWAGNLPCNLLYLPIYLLTGKKCKAFLPNTKGHTSKQNKTVFSLYSASHNQFFVYVTHEEQGI